MFKYNYNYFIFRDLLNFAIENDQLVESIAERFDNFIFWLLIILPTIVKSVTRPF